MVYGKFADGINEVSRNEKLKIHFDGSYASCLDRHVVKFPWERGPIIAIGPVPFFVISGNVHLGQTYAEKENLPMFLP